MIPTYKEIRFLANNIKQQAHILATLSGVKFARALCINIACIGRIIDFLDTKQQLSTEYIEYNNKRVTICENFCKQSEDSTLLYTTIDGKTFFDVDINNLDFINQMNELYNIYDKDIQKQNIQNDIYNTFLNTEIDKKWLNQFFKIKEEWIDENITVQQMELIMYFIE